MSPGVQAATRHGLIARERAGLAVHAAAALALIPAYALLAPPSSWDQPLLLAVLLALAVVVIRHDVPLPSGISFDATAALALIAVALAGPLPALAVIFPPIAVNALLGHERLLRAGNLANLAAYGWYTLAGALLLHALAPDPTAPAAIAWLLTAGIVQVLVNWAVGPAVYGTLWLGHPMRTLVVMLRDALPAGAAMAVLGAATVVLYGQHGQIALALFAIVAVIPQSARIAAVARTWAALTAEGSPRLGHLDALAHLEGAAGVRLDPRVVRAAHAVVSQERLSPAVPAPEPRLHHLRVPEPLRRVLAAGG